MPTAGAITDRQKLIVPVRKAYAVPSIFRGVTFANSDMIGSVKNKNPIMLNTTSVNNKKIKSLIPHSKFHL